MRAKHVSHTHAIGREAPCRTCCNNENTERGISDFLGNEYCFQNYCKSLMTASFFVFLSLPWSQEGKLIHCLQHLKTALLLSKDYHKITLWWELLQGLIDAFLLCYFLCNLIIEGKLNHSWFYCGSYNKGLAHGKVNAAVKPRDYDE